MPLWTAVIMLVLIALVCSPANANFDSIQESNLQINEMRRLRREERERAQQQEKAKKKKVKFDFNKQAESLRQNRDEAREALDRRNRDTAGHVRGASRGQPPMAPTVAPSTRQERQ